MMFDTSFFGFHGFFVAPQMSESYFPLTDLGQELFLSGNNMGIHQKIESQKMGRDWFTQDIRISVGMGLSGFLGFMGG